MNFLSLPGFFDYSIYSLQIALFAWVTMKRRILIFHDQWVSMTKKRLFINYLSIIVIIIYYEYKTYYWQSKYDETIGTSTSSAITTDNQEQN
jgi:hypothetical protein